MNLEKYLQKVYDEALVQEPQAEGGAIGGQMQKNAAEIKIVTNAAGEKKIAGFGYIAGQDLSVIVNKAIIGLQKMGKNTVEAQVAGLGAWIQKSDPEVWQAIQDIGGLEKLLGSQGDPDIRVVGAGKGKSVIITPDNPYNQKKPSYTWPQDKKQGAVQ
jgi:hypothetical protein